MNLFRFVWLLHKSKPAIRQKWTTEIVSWQNNNENRIFDWTRTGWIGQRRARQRPHSIGTAVYPIKRNNILVDAWHLQLHTTVNIKQNRQQRSKGKRWKWRKWNAQQQHSSFGASFSIITEKLFIVFGIIYRNSFILSNRINKIKCHRMAIGHKFVSKMMTIIGFQSRRSKANWNRKKT